MPKQEVFFEQKTAVGRIEVLKTYDQSYAREAFGSMDETAQAHLWSSLGIGKNYDPTDIPSQHDADSQDFLWEELLEAANTSLRQTPSACRQCQQTNL
jgi:hypothetical protein